MSQRNVKKPLGAQSATEDVSAGSIATDAAIARHTPGPWFLRHSNFITYVKADTGHKEIAVMYSDSGVDKQANARLIAAAPELLGEHRAWAQMFGEALVLAMQGDYSKVDELALAARIHFPNGSPELVSESIAKAEGRQS